MTVLRTHAIALLLSAFSGLVSAQQWQVPKPQTFETTAVCLGSLQQPLTVELADTMEQHARGLMQRESLGDYEGMLFRYPQVRPGSSGFWMYQTLIPLDIAYLNARGEVVKTFTMLPCGSDDPRQCRSYAPGKNYQFALEMRAGFFADHDIRLGDRVTIVGAVADGQQCDELLQ
jgi:uncharacterized membrane protein (UPF0127 family)